ncbi:helix-turn-helix domain-containing protein, partial [Nevskia soli]
MAEPQKASDLQRRRLKAGRLLQQGVHQSEVARRVGVSPEAVRKWRLKLEAEGPGALKDGRRGRPAGLDQAQRRELVKALKVGAVM